MNTAVFIGTKKAFFSAKKRQMIINVQHKTKAHNILATSNHKLITHLLYLILKK